MAYRDDLAAAMERIAALESELAATGKGDEQTAELRALNQRLERELERLKEEHRNMVREIESLSQKLYGRQSPVELTRMRLLPDHNRQYPSQPGGSPAGVLCPSCIAIGERVQLVHSSARLAEGSTGVASVICPRCASLGLLREG